MKRLLKTLTVTFALALALTGCGGDKAPAKEVDLSALATGLQSAVTLDSELLQMSDKNVADLYNLEAVDSYVVNLDPTGGSAEEVSVFKAKDGQGDAVKEMLEKRLESQKEKFENYVPGETFKLENAVLCQEGDLVALVVAADASGAQDAFDKALQ